MKWKIGIAAAGTVCVGLVIWTASYFWGGGYVQDQHIKQGEMAAANLMRDPESVKFRDVVYVEGHIEGFYEVCGEMNSKNLYGAYNGYVKFLYMPEVGVTVDNPLVPLGNLYSSCQVEGHKPHIADY